MEDLAQNINLLIKDSVTYKEYVFYKKEIEESEKLNALKSKLESIKKKNCKDHNEELISDYKELEKEYKSNVLVQKYEQAREELKMLLDDICDILSFK